MPETTVAAIVLDMAREKVLLTQRKIDPFRGYWCLPGGHIDKYEDAAMAVIREVQEETGLDFDGDFVFYHDEVIRFYGIHAVVLVFAGYGTEEVVAQPQEVGAVGWFTFDEALEKKLAFRHGKILERFMMESH